jgi:ribosome biogenesis GTPase
VALIQRVLERRSKFSRKEAGQRSAEQIIAANVDTVFLVQSLNRNFNPRRLERYLALLWESGAEPVVVLSKADLCPDPEELVAAAAEAAPGVAVHVTSAVSPDGLEPLAPYLRPGRTVALVGSSGVGKSTIVNRLAGRELLRVREIREDDRGVHTTTARHLVLLPGGGMLLDTPGMRTVLLWEGEEGLGRAFEDVEGFAARCRFRDCTHDSEPGCAVRGAVEEGTLDPARLRSYTKLQKEARYQARKTDVRLRLAEQRRWRRIMMEARRRPDKRSG